MTTSNEIKSDFIAVAIDTEVKRYIEQRYEQNKKEFLEQLDRDKAKELAGISLHIMKMVDISQSSDRTVITLRTVKQ